MWSGTLINRTRKSEAWDCPAGQSKGQSHHLHLSNPPIQPQLVSLYCRYYSMLAPALQSVSILPSCSALGC